MNHKKYNKYLNLTLLVGAIFAFFLWQVFFQKVSSNPIFSEARISFLNVGQANAELINLPNSTQILLDAGRDQSAADVVMSRMPPFDKKIEFVVLSHPDADHIGGMEKIMDNYQIGEIIKTKAVSQSNLFERIEKKIDEKKIKVLVPSRGDKISFLSDAIGEVLSPDEEKIESLTLNNSSIVLRFCYKTACAIFPGDAEREAQDEILKNFNADELKTEILEASHHGAANGLNENFQKVVNPKYEVISVGKNNKYGHPAQITLDFLNGFGVKILRTDKDGTIDFDFDNGQWKLAK